MDLAKHAHLIDELAGSVIDGTPVDWTSATVEASASPLLAQLQIVAAVAQVHRTAALPSAIPETWGHLKILERIGRGSFGDVYRAWDSRLDREVALKLIPTLGLADDQLPSSIIQEGRLLARVRHPNVAVIHGAEQIGQRTGLWMELVRGRTLEEALGDRTFTPDEVIRIGIDLAGAVAAVHAAGLLHRDIKAQNVMQSEDGRVVLMDFGTGRESVDERSDLAGTPLYLAPEVFAGQAASAQSDVYSLGVLLYHLLTGSFPVQGRTPAEVRRAHELTERIDLRAACPGAPARLVAAISRAIDPDPGRRYPSADALGHELERLLPRSRGRWLGYVAAAALGIALVFTARGLLPDSRARALSGPVLSAGEPLTIAVLPFASLSPEPDGQLVADGLTSEIAHRLGVIDGLSVHAAEISSAVPRPKVDIRTAGRDLHVNLVLTGSVVASSGQLLVKADLVRVADLALVWSDSFPQTGGNVKTAQDELSLSIVNRLRLHVGQGQRRYDRDPDVNQLFLKAQSFLERRHIDNSRLAAELFEQVLARDPSDAPSLAGLASAIGAFSRARPGESMPPPDPRMDEAANKAFLIDPLLPQALSAMGSLRARDREFLKAEAFFREALRRNPTLTTTYTEFVLTVLEPMNRDDESLELLKEAQSVAQDSYDVRRVMAMVQVDLGLYQDAIESAQWVLERDPVFPFASKWLGRALMLSGRVDEAQAIFERPPVDAGLLGYLYARTGRRQEALALAAEHAGEPMRLMLIYGGLRDKDRAFDALEKEIALGFWWRAAHWMHRPEMEVLRGDPRLEAIRKRLGLSQ